MPTTPNHTPQTTETLPSDAVREHYSLDSLAEWRRSDDEVLADMRRNAAVGDTEYIDDFKSGTDQRLDAYLQEKGIESNDPHYDEDKEAPRRSRYRCNRRGCVGQFTCKPWRRCKRSPIRTR